MKKKLNRIFQAMAITSKKISLMKIKICPNKFNIKFTIICIFIAISLLTLFTAIVLLYYPPLCVLCMLLPKGGGCACAENFELLFHNISKF